MGTSNGDFLLQFSGLILSVRYQRVIRMREQAGAEYGQLIAVPIWTTMMIHPSLSIVLEYWILQ